MAQNQDIWLLMGLGLFGICATFIIHRQLRSVQEAVAPTQVDQSPSRVNQPTEDAFKLETLDSLSRNANDGIRNAAIKIVVDRTTKAETLGLLWKDMGGGDMEWRKKALTTAKFLTNTLPQCFEEHRTAAFDAVIQCLCNLYPQALIYETASMQEKALYRSQVENDALGILYFLITQFGVNLAIKCGLVHRWLAGYPFGGYAVPKVLGSTAAQRFVIQKFVNRLVLREQPDSVMSDIIICVLNDEQGHQQMIQVGLVPESTVSEFYSLVSTYGPDSASQHANEDDDSNTHRRLFGRLDQLWHEVNGHRMDHDAHTVPMMRRGQRVREESIEEQTLRRRRREVMVLGEPGQPIARDHIVESIQ